MKPNNYLLLLVVLSLLAIQLSYAQEKVSKETIAILTEIYNKADRPEISLKKFIEINSHAYSNQTKANGRVSGVSALAGPQDQFCSKVRPYCTNGNFESGLDQNQYSGAYGTNTQDLYPNPFTLPQGFSSGALNSGAAHQTIVNKASGNDPTTGIPLVPGNGGNQALRLGNTVDGYGTELIAKTIIVDPNETILSFYYAVVFEDPGHPVIDQPAFSVRAYDCATGTELPNVCNLGNGTNIVVSDADNPFFKSMNNGNIAYRDWSVAQINLSAHIGKTVTIVFTNKDCGQGAHWGYTYLDNLFSRDCPPPPDPQNPQPAEGNIQLDGKSSNCGAGNICAKYTLPSIVNNGVTTTGSIAITLDIYQNNVLVKTFNSPSLGTGSSYCFSINPATLGLNPALAGFDYAITGKFTLAGFALAPIIVGNPPTGQISGINNDYLNACPTLNDYYSKPAGDLHNVLSWGVNPDGTGANPPDFGAGKTFHLVNRVPTYTMTANWTVGGKLDIPSGSQLRINGYTLSEADLIGTGTLYGTTTSSLIVTTGTTPGNALNFASGGGSLNNLTVNRMGGSATIGTPLSIYGVLTATSGTINTGNNITLKSTAANTARVAPVTGTVSGNVTVERYIPARRAWRIMSAPIGGSQTINAAWQEGSTTSSPNPNPNPGFGTHITEGSAANGFDHNPLVAMISIKKYISSSDTWTPLANTNATPVNGDAYLLFVRGHRATPLGYNTVAPTITTLRATGPLRTGNQMFPVSATGFTAIPNPFASPINFATITRNNVQNNFYLWDPKLGGADGVGGYVLLSDNGSGGYNITPAPVSPESQLIQSGQGFLVRSTGVAGNLIIKESDKSPTAATNVFRSANTTVGLRTTLKVTDKDNTEAVLDEVYSIYDHNFSNKVDHMDPVKLSNINENLGILREEQTLMLERRQEVLGNDTIHLKLWNTMPRQDYFLQFIPERLSSSTITAAYVEDRYLHTTTSINLTEETKVKFRVDGNPASASSDRFIIVLSGGKNILPADITLIKSTIKLSHNPITGKTVNLQFANQPKGTYNIVLINNLGQLIYKGQIKHSGGSSTQALQLGNNFVKGMYKLRVTNEQAKFKLAIPVMGN